MHDAEGLAEYDKGSGNFSYKNVTVQPTEEELVMPEDELMKYLVPQGGNSLN